MRKHLFSIILSTLTVFSMAQTADLTEENTLTATDFTSVDRNGNSVNLFTELNSGKVIVLCWTMPCSGCITPAYTAYNAVADYQTSNPNTVYFYLTDDYADDSVNDIHNWGNNYGIPESEWSLRFSDAAITMDDYESYGMPKTIVIAGYNHTVFYNSNYTVNSTELNNAISEAIVYAGINEISSSISSLNIFPNPAKNHTEINFNLKKTSDFKAELYNMQGKKIDNVFSGQLLRGENSLKVDVSAYESGMYLVKLSDGNSSQFFNLVVSH